MVFQELIGPGQTGLLISTRLMYRRIIYLQAKPYIALPRTVADLQLDYLVPKIGKRNHVLDTADQQFTFTQIPFNVRSTLDPHFTVVFCPQVQNRVKPMKNTALQTMIGSSKASWAGNIVVVAHSNSGRLVPFTEAHIDTVQLLFTRLLRSLSVKDALKYVHWQNENPKAPLTASAELGVEPCGFILPNELILKIVKDCDTKSLTAMGAASRGLRGMVKATFTTIVKDTLALFIPAKKIADFFHVLTESQGVVFGDVALAVQLKRNWQIVEMEIAVPRGNHVALMGWLSACGYAKRQVDRAHCNIATANIIAMQKETEPNRWINICESEHGFAVASVLASKSSARMTMLTAHALVSPYTSLTEKEICITTTLLDVAHFLELGFKARLDAKKLGFPCSIYCPRNKRIFAKRPEIDIICWGGVEGNGGIPDRELTIFQTSIVWSLGKTCSNVLCGSYGIDHNVEVF